MNSTESTSKHDRFLVGPISDKLPPHQLSTNRDILKYLFYKKQKASEKTKWKPSKMGLISCPLKNQAADCEGTNSCTEEDPCLVRAAKQAWDLAGFPVMSDNSIRYVHKNRGDIKENL